MADDKQDKRDDNNAPFGGLLFSEEMLDNAPRHDHDCGLPHVDGRCPREVMVKLLRPNAGDGLFANQSEVSRQAIRDSFMLPKELLQHQGDWNVAIAHETMDFYRAKLIGSMHATNYRAGQSATLYGAANGLEAMVASEVSARATIAAQASPDPNNVVVLDADHEALLGSGGECRVTFVHPDVLAALAGAMGDAMRGIGTGPQCTEHDLFTDDDGVQCCVFCMATQEEIDAEESLLQAQAYEAVYGACEHCGAFDDDIHDANCPRRPCTEEEDAAHEQRACDPGRHDDDFDPNWPDDDDVVIDPPTEPEDGCDE